MPHCGSKQRQSVLVPLFPTTVSPFRRNTGPTHTTWLAFTRRVRGRVARLSFAVILTTFVLQSAPASSDEDITRNAIKLYALSTSFRLDDDGIARVVATRESSRSFCGHYSAKCPTNLWKYTFDQDTFDLSSHRYSDPWFAFLNNYTPLKEAVNLLLEQFNSLARRLDTLHEHRRRLVSKFSAYYETEDYLEPIDNDIRYLSAQAAQLATVTEKFFDTVKPKVIHAEMRVERLAARREGMGGLRSFESDIAEAKSMQDDALTDSMEEIIAMVQHAVRELEEAMAE